MAKLVWDQTGKRYYETGVSQVVLYPANSAGNGTYTTGVAWNGVTSINESPDGADPNDLWADNIKYASLYSNETFGFTIEAYTYPDEWNSCMGRPNIAGAYVGQQKHLGFGLCYRTEIGNDTPTDGDDGYLLHIIYNAMAQPSDSDYETINDSPDAIQFSWECTTTPIDLGITGIKQPAATMTIDSRKFTKAKMTALEDILYGRDAASGVTPLTPTLPTPSTIVSTLLS